MLFTIHTDGDLPIYEQIVSQVIYGVATETLEVGGLIPSVHRANWPKRCSYIPTRVAKAFQLLEREGILAARRESAWKWRAMPWPRAEGQRRDLVRRSRQSLARGGRQWPDRRRSAPLGRRGIHAGQWEKAKVGAAALTELARSPNIGLPRRQWDIAERIPSPPYSGERGRGEGVEPPHAMPPHPQPLSPEYRGEGRRLAVAQLY